MQMIETPTIELLTANLGNRLFQFFAAQALIARAGRGRVSNAEFAEWGLSFPRADPERYRRVITVDRIGDFDIPVLAAALEREGSVFVRIRHHLQRQSLYLSKDVYNQIFPIIAPCEPAGAGALLINIRTGDILGGGSPWYTLLPVAFYRDIVERTGLQPVFMGQLDPCAYVDQLRAAFPDAVFQASRGPIADFDMIRSATHIVPAVSTFSLAAAWLSNARTIHLPLSGFLNPAHKREIDLLPVDDQRYRFYLFPMYVALPEPLALAHHARLAGTWQEISRSHLAVLQTNAPFITPSASGCDDSPVPDFDETFYVHTHIDAALQISRGFYENGLHHYKDIGRRLGYAPGPLGRRDMPWPNLALNAPAWQSSRSIWSNGRSVQEDAMNAVNGDRCKTECFHTDLDHEPWWMVDCGAPFVLREVHVYNRKGAASLQARATPLLIEASADRATWQAVLRTADGFVFGVGDQALVPLVGRPDGRLVARFIRISIPGKTTYLHLSEVEVYGIPI